MPPPGLPQPPPLPQQSQRPPWLLIFVLCGLGLVAVMVWTVWEVSSNAKKASQSTREGLRRMQWQMDLAYELTWQRKPGEEMDPQEVYRAALETVAEDHQMKPEKLRAEMEALWKLDRSQKIVLSKRMRAAFTTGRFTECIEEADKVLQSEPGWLDRLDVRRDLAQGTKSRALYILGRSPEAVEPARAAVVIAQKSGGEEHLEAQSWLARVLSDCERFDEALTTYREMLAAAKTHEVAPGEWTILATDSLRWLLDEKMDRPGEAEPFARRVVELQRLVEGEPSAEAGEARYTLGELLYRLDRVEEAATELVAALEQQRKVLEPGDDALGDTLLQLAEVRESQKRYAEARQLGAEGLEIYTEAYGAEDERVKEWQDWFDQLPASSAAKP